MNKYTYLAAACLCLGLYGQPARGGTGLKRHPRAQSDTEAVAPTPTQNDTKVTAVGRPDISRTNAYYIGNRTPLEPLNFIKLPVGSIRAEGWIRKYLELQKDGLTGHLGEISAWLEKKDNAWYSGNGSGSHGWEEVPYWLKGYGDLGYLLKDETMIRTTKEWLEKVFESQRPDGYFGPRMVENEHQDNKGTTPDLWPNMLMLWCMQSYYEYSGDPRVISFMTKYFQWQKTVPDSQLLKIYWENSRGGDNLYSIYWLYNITGQPWLLDLAVKIHRNTANWTQGNTLPNWHNVNVAQCFREPATYYMQTKDSFYLQATYKDYYLIRQLYGQVPGGMFGADENARPGYTDPRQAVETCGMVEQMASDELLMGITGDPMWGDNCEDVAFNTYPAAVMPDFRGLRYLTAPNMVISDTMNHSPGIQNGGPFLVMNPFSSRCCQHNHSQGWPYYAEHMWMATPDNGVAALLYNSCTVKAYVGGDEPNATRGLQPADKVQATFSESTHYPFEDKIRISVNLPRTAYFPLYLRIPGWCGNARVWVNGTAATATFAGDDYAKIERTWKAGDIVELELPMKVRVKTWTENKNSVSVNYGPLTFSLKIKEDYVKINGTAGVQQDAKWQTGVDQTQWPAYEILPGSAWNYGLALGTEAGTGTETKAGISPASGDFTVIRRPWPKDDFPFSQGSAPIQIKTKGREIPAWKVDQYGLCGLLPQSPVAVSTPEQEITLIPMGAARLRISAFPQTNIQTDNTSVQTDTTSPRPVWSAQKANDWYQQWGWLRGSNFIPSTAINQLEMWQAETFDTATIDRELGYAQGIGFNAMRVFLHHVAWEEDPAGFKNRVEAYLDIAHRRGIATIFVLFDDCWSPTNHPGPQPAPRTGIHNSGWVQDPGILIHRDSANLYPVLEKYVKDMLGHFGKDKRIILWDVYNEPGNGGHGDSSLALLAHVFEWGREVNPEQPLSAGVWTSDLVTLGKFQLANSDVITYHNYGSPEDQQKEIDSLRALGRPLICTEYMARPRGSLFTNVMPVLKQNNVGAINWGLVSGKTNTIFAWDKPMPDGSQPKVWFHDIFRKDGTPFSPAEITLIKTLTNKQ